MFSFTINKAYNDCTKATKQHWLRFNAYIKQHIFLCRMASIQFMYALFGTDMKLVVAIKVFEIVIAF
jgi:hypothetical protein